MYSLPAAQLQIVKFRLDFRLALCIGRKLIAVFLARSGGLGIAVHGDDCSFVVLPNA